MAGHVRERIREFKDAKPQRYREYEELLDRALAAGAQAVLDMPQAARKRGAVWVRLNDARSSFARFLKETDAARPVRHYPGGDARWVRGDRKMGTHLPATLKDFDRAMAWSKAVAGVLASGDVAVTIGDDFITEP